MLSVLVTTFNEAENLPACLEGVRWADEIVVVDSGSTDATAAIARRNGATLLEHPYESAARQKNWALPRLRHPWVLILDADERVPEALATQIAAVVRDDGPADGYFLRRRSFFLGREIRHCGWGQDRVLRLFRRDRGEYDDRWVHEALQLNGRAAELATPLLHVSYRSVDDALDKIRRYTVRGAADLQSRGRRPSWFAPIVRPPARFVRMYFLQGGFLDGAHGLILCLLTAYSVWLKYAQLHEPVRAEIATDAAATPGSAAANFRSGT